MYGNHRTRGSNPLLSAIILKSLVDFGNGEPPELLRRRYERDVAHDLQGLQHGLRFRVLDVAHLKAVL